LFAEKNLNQLIEKFFIFPLMSNRTPG